MRTAIYVHEPTRVTIRALDERDRAVELTPYRLATAPRLGVGAYAIGPGIYMIHSVGALVVDGAGVTVEATTDDKDPWPDPKAHLLALEPGASVASVQARFDLAKPIGD
jgi:hypothetical protein